jgi:TolA-binding protein
MILLLVVPIVSVIGSGLVWFERSRLKSKLQYEITSLQSEVSSLQSEITSLQEKNKQERMQLGTDINKGLNALRSEEANAAIHPYLMLAKVKEEVNKLIGR